jgi:hypothetical protein
MARLSREVIITEKIDGTNASIYIDDDGTFLTGSRTQWINVGFKQTLGDDGHKGQIQR